MKNRNFSPITLANFKFIYTVQKFGVLVSSEINKINFTW